MNFNLDDPLAGILSDGSDDSFFDDDILGKKKPAKKKSTPTTQRKTELFDLDQESKLSSDNTKANKIDTVKPTSPAPFKRNLSKESLIIPESKNKESDLSISPAKSKLATSADKLDILDELGPSAKKAPNKPLEKGKSSQSLLDEILGGSSSKTTGANLASRPVTAKKSQDFDFDSILGKTESKQSISSKPVFQKAPKIDTAKEANPPKKTKQADDWLGIFQGKDDVVDEEDETDMPLWLGGGGSKKKKENESKEIKEDTAKENDDTKTKQEIVKEPEKEVQRDTNHRDYDPLVKTQIQSKLEVSNDDLTMEGATLCLQQQESQLMVALQLKAQDEKLAAIQLRQKENQRVQREAALAHHSQIDDMLRRQAEHRLQMQTIIAAHQERITQRIKALLGSTNVEHETESNRNNDYSVPAGEQVESPHQRETKQLLQLVQSLQENHDKEIDLMETSYRRQLAFLEVSFNQSEERMKEESDKLVKFYAEKIHWLEEHHQLYKKLAEDNLNSLTERHKAENEMLRQQHLDNVKVLHEHHAALMENIKNAVKQEQALIKDSVSFSTDLQELIADVRENNSKNQQLVAKIESLANNTQDSNERSVEAREAQINDMLQQLKKDRDNFEKEKSESKDMVNMLELRLKQMTTMIEEESVSLKQKKMEFEFEKATFSKQTEFAKNVLKKQDEEMKMLREDIQKEYQDKISKVEEERMKAIKESALVAKEKASIQNIKLEIERTKAELQAQLDEVTETRSKLNVEKQELHMEEQRILAKSRDLDLLAKTAMEKQAQADKKHSESEFLQKKYEERLRRMQEHVVSLNTREKQIAKEKVALSRERLSLHNEKKQIESRQQCSLCRPTTYNYDQYIAPENYLNMPVSRDYGNINSIETEMANLVSRSYNVGYGVAVNPNEDRHVSEADEDFQATQAESGAFKEYMDPKFMMLRLDVQQVINNLDQGKKDDGERPED